MTDKTKEAPARSALKLALEALNKSVDNFPANRLHRHAIWAVREALASGASEDSSGTAQPAQPQQKPVAVWELFEDGWDSIADPSWMETLPVGTKLYTSPPVQRTWGGLTDEEIDDIASEHSDEFGMIAPDGWEDFARAIEAAHGITKE